MASTIIEALQRVDPSTGFVDYVNHVKPYHTKILEVLEEYVWTDYINATVTESHTFALDFTRPDLIVSFNEGWGVEWDTPDYAESQIFRITDIDSGLSGSVTVEGDRTGNVVIGSSIMVLINNATTSNTALYTVTSTSYNSLDDTTLIVVDPAQSMLTLPVFPSPLQTYGFVFTTTAVRETVLSNNSIVVANDSLNQMQTAYPAGTYITLFQKAAAPLVTPVATYIVQGIDFDLRVIDVDVGTNELLVSGDRAADFSPPGSQFLLVDPSNGSTITLTVPSSSSAVYYAQDAGTGLTNITRVPTSAPVSTAYHDRHIIPVLESVVHLSTNDRTLLTVKSDLSDVHGTKYFVQSGDQTGAFIVGNTYTFTPDSGWMRPDNGIDPPVNVSYNITVVDTHHIPLSPSTSDPFYLTGLTDHTVITATVNSSSLSGTLDDVDVGTIVEIAPGSTNYFIVVGGFGWSQPEYVTNATPQHYWTDDTRVATTSNVTLSGLQTIDGVSVIAGDRVLVRSQTISSENGVYIVAAGSWSLVPVSVGTATQVLEGTNYADTSWHLVSSGADTVWSSFKFNTVPALYADTYVSENLQIDIFDTFV